MDHESDKTVYNKIKPYICVIVVFATFRFCYTYTTTKSNENIRVITNFTKSKTKPLHYMVAA